MSLSNAHRPANRRERYRLMAAAATQPFAVAAVAIPLLLPVLGYLSNDYRIMFTVHLPSVRSGSALRCWARSSSVP